MRSHRFFFLPFLLFAVCCACAQQPRSLQADSAAATRDHITSNLKFGSGKTLSLLSGSTLSIAGTLSGTPTGGTLDLSALTLTLPAAYSLPSVTGNSGKFLTNNGTATSWATIAGGGDVLASNNLSEFTASAATARANLGLTIGTHVAPATSGTSILYGNGSGGFSAATVGGNLSFSGGTLNLSTTPNIGAATGTSFFGSSTTDAIDATGLTGGLGTLGGLSVSKTGVFGGVVYVADGSTINMITIDGGGPENIAVTYSGSGQIVPDGQWGVYSASFTTDRRYRATSAADNGSTTYGYHAMVRLTVEDQPTTGTHDLFGAYIDADRRGAYPGRLYGAWVNASFKGTGDSATVVNGLKLTADLNVAAAGTFPSLAGIDLSYGRQFTSATITDAYGIKLTQLGDATNLVNNYGLYIGDITGTTSAYSIYTGAGLVRFGGNVSTTGTLSASNLSGTNTGDQTTITGNAGTATALQTARTINGVSFDGTANITVPAAGSTLTDTVPVAKGGTGATTLTGIIKGNGTSAFSAAVSGTDYAPATSGTSILYGNGAGGFSAATVGGNLSFSGGTLNLSATPNIGTATGTSLTIGDLHLTMAALTFDGGGVVGSNTSNGADNTYVALAGGGVSATSGRGGHVKVYGNEWATAAATGRVDIVAGYDAGMSDADAGAIEFFTGGSATARLKILRGGSAAFSGALTASNLSGTNTGDQTITLSGDVSGSGTAGITATLATVNSNVGTFGSATAAGVVTVNAKGLVTAVSNTTITPAVGSITGLGTGVGTWLATPSSANLAAALTDEIGTGPAQMANIVFNNQTGTSYELVAADAGKYVTMSNASANVLTVPDNTTVSYSAGTSILVEMRGAGATSISPKNANVTIQSRDAALKLYGQYSVAVLTLHTVSGNATTWNLSGDIKP